MADVVQLAWIAEGGDGDTYLMQRGDFRWVRKLTTEAPLDPFKVGLQAYKRIGASSSLDGWVPKCYGFGDRRLELELIDGCQLEELAPQLTIEALHEMHVILQEVVLRLHDIGVVHGDIRPYNIMVDQKVDPPEPVLIDFSRAQFPHARFRHKVFDWEAAKRQDLGSLAGIFQEAICAKHCSEALRMLELKSLGHEPSVPELAEHLEESGLWTDKLLAALNTTNVREPLYIVAMTRNLMDNRSWEALKFIEEYLPKVASCQLQNPAIADQRSMTMLHAYKAKLSGEGDCLHYLPAAIKLCADSLGYMDNFTVSMRLNFAQRNILHTCDRQLLETLLREVTEFAPENDMKTETQHLYYEPLQKEYLIEVIHKSLKLADRLVAQHQPLEAHDRP